jgi:hypothetical protein
LKKVGLPFGTWVVIVGAREVKDFKNKKLKNLRRKK